MIENRSRLRRIGGVTVLLALVATLVACGSDDKSDTAAESSSSPAELASAEPTAGSWKTWVLPSASAISVPAPPAAGSGQAAADLAEVKKLAAERTPEVSETVERWSGPVPTRPGPA